MTIVNCHSPDTVCETASQCSPKTSPSCLSFLLLPPRLVTASLSGALDVIRKTLDGQYSDCCPSCHGHHAKDKPCCDIPETDCPSPYVCYINWYGCPGDTLHYQIQVTNTGKIKREFNLTPVHFPCTDEVVSIAPNKKALLPEQSFKATVSFTIPTSFGGGTYRTRINVAGAYEQFILVCLHVQPQQHCCCAIDQGEIPTHIKKHLWFHHFQCEEQCFEPVEKEG